MRTMIYRGVLLAGALMAGTVAGVAQKPASPLTADASVTYSPERAQLAQTGTTKFWLQAGSADVAVTFYRGLGMAMQVGEGVATSLGSGVNAQKFTFVAGPRYTYSLGKLGVPGSSSRIFGEALFGASHAFNGVYPTSVGVSSSANSSAIQIGAGYDMTLSHGWGVRLFEADWVRTAFSNASANTQNDFRMAFGISYHVGRKK